jgi:hypothetical protein
MLALVAGAIAEADLLAEVRDTTIGVEQQQMAKLEMGLGLHALAGPFPEHGEGGAMSPGDGGDGPFARLSAGKWYKWFRIVVDPSLLDAGERSSYPPRFVRRRSPSRRGRFARMPRCRQDGDTARRHHCHSASVEDVPLALEHGADRQALVGAAPAPRGIGLGIDPHRGLLDALPRTTARGQDVAEINEAGSVQGEDLQVRPWQTEPRADRVAPQREPCDDFAARGRPRAGHADEEPAYPFGLFRGGFCEGRVEPVRALAGPFSAQALDLPERPIEAPLTLGGKATTAVAG